MAPRQKVAIIGGGAAGIMCAIHLDFDKYEVHLFEKTSRLGRKLLVAGEGGFNLTYHEPIDDLIDKYSPKEFMKEALRYFSNTDLREWLLSIGIETYVGSSSRVFPVKGLKPYMVVNKLLATMESRGVAVHTEAEWLGWAGESLRFNILDEEQMLTFDSVVFALGGASWSKTGSDGSWLEKFKDRGILCEPFQPSNCGWLVSWPEKILPLVEGQPLKNITATVRETTVHGEAMITRQGIEGGAIYALAEPIRQLINSDRVATIFLDLKPTMDVHSLEQKLVNRRKSVKHTLEKVIRLSSPAIALIQHMVSKEEYNDPCRLAELIKAFPLTTRESEEIDKAISTVGGVALEAVTSNYEIKVLPKHYVIGEMLNWDTRTGGYLLQGSFSQGKFLANKLSA